MKKLLLLLLYLLAAVTVFSQSEKQNIKSINVKKNLGCNSKGKIITSGNAHKYLKNLRLSVTVALPNPIISLIRPTHD